MHSDFGFTEQKSFVERKGQVGKGGSSMGQRPYGEEDEGQKIKERFILIIRVWLQAVHLQDPNDKE